MMRLRLRFRAILLTLVVLVTPNLFGQDSPFGNDSKTNAFASGDVIRSANLGSGSEATGLPTAPSSVAPAFSPVSPAKVEKRNESEKSFARNKKIWYGLAFASHGAAVFDAWSTNAAVDRGAKELNPLMRPVAGTGWIYPVAQLGPLGMDYLARRMMRSDNPVLRKIWWLPQSLSAVTSFAAGFHNMQVNR